MQIKFKVGDVINQRGQHLTPCRLVIALTSDPEIVWVHDPEAGVRKAFTWSHDLTTRTSRETIAEALELVSRGCIERSNWS